MARIQPFRALRFDPRSIPDLSRVIAPPYDVIDAEEQTRLHAASPHNIVHLILGKQSAADTEADNRYTRARTAYDAWRREGVLTRDGQPALYVTEHRYTVDGVTRARIGFTGLLEFEEPIERVVFRHEATLSGPKADRTKLLDAVPANLSPVFCLYPDTGGAVAALLQDLVRRTAPAVSASYRGDTVRLWVVTDAEVIRRVAEGLAKTPVLIADGHHRFEVAFSRRDRHKAVMSYFVSFQDPGLAVRPIHRILRGVSPAQAKALEALCVLEPARDLGALLQWLQEGHGAGRFGYCGAGKLFKTSLRPERLTQWLAAPSVPAPIAGFDVAILHGLILPAAGMAGAEIRYSAQAGEVVQAAGEGGADTAAWLLRGIPTPEVYRVASQGVILPPKSTYFYPKVLSGLTVNPLDGEPVRGLAG